MLSLIFSSFFVIAILTNPIESAGINCKGSLSCNSVGKHTYVAKQLTNYTSYIDPNRWYANQEQIACASAAVVSDSARLRTRKTQMNWYCAFLQNTNGAWGSKISELTHYIADHGCDVCGSVP